MAITPNPKVPPELEFRALKPVDRYEVESLWARRVGIGIENTLDLAFDGDEAVYTIAATEVERVVGFGVVMVLTAAGVEEYFRVPTDDFPTGEVNAVLHAGAVAEDWEGRGIGSELMRLRLEMVHEAHDVDAAFGNAWLRPHTGDVSRLFERHGFERLRTVEEFYRETEGDRDCPDCSPDPCTCSSAIYGRRMQDWASADTC